MTELEKIEYARAFIGKMANGINPIDNTEIPINDVASHPRLKRCFSYVSEVLAQIVLNGKKAEARKKKVARSYFSITFEQLQEFNYSSTPITISEFCRRLESLVDLRKMKRISRQSMPEWLVSLNLLTPPRNNGTRYSASVPTSEGSKLGIIRIEITNERGTHQVNALTLEAQKFIIDNMESFIAFRKRSKYKL